MKKIISIITLACFALLLPFSLVGCSKKANKVAEKISAETFFDTEWVCTEIISDKYSGTQLYSKLSFNFTDETGIIEDNCFDFYSTQKDGQYNGKLWSVDINNYDDFTWTFDKAESKLNLSGHYFGYSITYKNNKLYVPGTAYDDDGEFEYTLIYEKR